MFKKGFLKVKRNLAVILSAAMIFSSFSVPTYAAEDFEVSDEFVAGDEGQSVEESNEVVSDEENVSVEEASGEKDKAEAEQETAPVVVSEEAEVEEADDTEFEAVTEETAEEVSGVEEEDVLGADAPTIDSALYVLDEDTGVKVFNGNWTLNGSDATRVIAWDFTGVSKVTNLTEESGWIDGIRGYTNNDKKYPQIKSGILNIGASTDLDVKLDDNISSIGVWALSTTKSEDRDLVIKGSGTDTITNNTKTMNGGMYDLTTANGGNLIAGQYIQVNDGYTYVSFYSGGKTAADIKITKLIVTEHDSDITPVNVQISDTDSDDNITVKVNGTNKSDFSSLSLRKRSEIEISPVSGRKITDIKVDDVSIGSSELPEAGETFTFFTNGANSIVVTTEELNVYKVNYSNFPHQ